MPVTYDYRADECPALTVPASVLDPAGGYPLVASRFALGMNPSLAVPIMQELAVRTDLAGRHGGGMPAAVSGLDLSDGGGLTVLIGAGQALIDGAVTLDVADDADLADDTRNHVWLGQAGDPVVTTDLLAPAGVKAYLGSVITAGGAITGIDYSGRVTLHGLALRRTADLAMPLDTPPAGCYFLTAAPSGLWVWDGAGYWLLSSVLAAQKSVIAVGETMSVPADYQARYFDRLTVNGRVVVNGRLRVDG
jgi:hypothetical protein